MLDGKLSLLRKQESMRAASRALGPGGDAAPLILTDYDTNNSEMPKVMEFSAPADNGPFQFYDQFTEFDFAEPPLPEIQILRVLDSHITRKQKDHLEKARRFKEELIKKKNSEMQQVTRNVAEGGAEGGG